jgi:hypothetical protein
MKKLALKANERAVDSFAIPAEVPAGETVRV